ncbi:MAG: hypothetical protein IT236_14675 [Bacteroidia bacterium]|nr:hypothetical protein [Bacteroidia bacterium]
MLNNLAEILLKSKIEKDNAQRKRRFLNWDKIEKIALIVSKDEALNKSAIDTYIERTKKYVEVFHIELNSKEPSYGDWECFSKKDKSLLRLPKKNRIEKLKTKNFDLVINTSNTDELFSTSLSSSINAALKCGTSERFNDTDLIIVKKESGNLIKYLDDVVTYLKMIKN